MHVSIKQHMAPTGDCRASGASSGGSVACGEPGRARKQSTRRQPAASTYKAHLWLERPQK